MAFLLLAGAAIGGLAGYAVGSWSHQPHYWYPYAPVYSPIPWHSPSYAAYAPTYPGYGFGYGSGFGYGPGYGSGYGYGSGLGYGSGFGYGSGYGSGFGHGYPYW